MDVNMIVKFFKRFTFCFILTSLALVLMQGLRISAAAGKVSYTAIPYEQNNPNASLKVLFMGDSTAFGTGAANNRESTAGWFGQEYPGAMIQNLSENGLRLSGLVKKFNPEAKDHFNLIVMQIGANDILRFTAYRNIERDLLTLIDRAQSVADHVVILHSGNVGTAPVFGWPLNDIYTTRSRAVRQLYIKTAKEKGVIYVDLFQERTDDLFLTDINKYYSADRLHPSGQGYRWWYDHIRQALNDANVAL